MTAIKTAAACRVLYKVVSVSHRHEAYQVRKYVDRHRVAGYTVVLLPGRGSHMSCGCPHAMYRKEACKHMALVKMIVKGKAEMGVAYFHNAGKWEGRRDHARN